MSKKLCLTSPTGKLGGAVLRNLLAHNLVEPAELVLSTSSDPADPRWEELKSKGTLVRKGTYDDLDSMVAAMAGCDRLFLASTPRIQMDFNDAPPGKGREAHHFVALEAARRAGIQHVYYTSLGFGDDSLSGVMTAHLRTEAFLKEQKDFSYTIIREGLYNESWPLYLGHSSMDGKMDRSEIPICGYGPVSWTAIDDLGLGTAAIIGDASMQYVGKTLTLSNMKALDLNDVANLVSRYSGKSVRIRLVSKQEHEHYYTYERHLDSAQVQWWSKSYEALEAKECLKQDPLLIQLLSQYGRSPIELEETLSKMYEASA